MSKLDLSKFKKIQAKTSYDEDASKNGRWFDCDGLFRLKCLSFKNSNRKVQLEFIKFADDKATLSDGVEFFVEHLVVDWELKDDNGRSVPFDKTLAKQLLPTFNTAMETFLSEALKPDAYLKVNVIKSKKKS